MKEYRKAGSEEHGKYISLIQQFKNLEEEWESIEKSRPPKPRACSTGSDSGILTCFDQLLKNSPTVLMSSLQQMTRSPSGGAFCRLKNCDTAVEEILTDRRTAIMSGKIKGRRLFCEEEKSASEEECEFSYGGGGGGGEICSDWLNMIQEREVIVNENRDQHDMPVAFDRCFSFSDSSPSEEKVVEENEKTVVKKRGGGGCMNMAMASFAFGLILLAIGLISMICNGNSVDKNELIPVPT